MVVVPAWMGSEMGPARAAFPPRATTNRVGPTQTVRRLRRLTIVPPIAFAEVQRSMYTPWRSSTKMSQKRRSLPARCPLPAVLAHPRPGLVVEPANARWHASRRQTPSRRAGTREGRAPSSAATGHHVSKTGHRTHAPTRTRTAVSTSERLSALGRRSVRRAQNGTCAGGDQPPKSFWGHWGFFLQQSHIVERARVWVSRGEGPIGNCLPFPGRHSKSS